MSLSVVGALVLGEAAVSAGFVSTPAIIIVAFSGICLYTVPDFVEAGSILRWLYLLVAGSLGPFGIVLLSAFLLYYLLSAEAFGTPLLAPFSPARAPRPQRFGRQIRHTEPDRTPPDLPPGKPRAAEREKSLRGKGEREKKRRRKGRNRKKRTTDKEEKRDDQNRTDGVCRQRKTALLFRGLSRARVQTARRARPAVLFRQRGSAPARAGALSLAGLRAGCHPLSRLPARKRAFSGSSKRGWGSPRRRSPTGLTPSTSPFPHSPPCSISSGSSTPPFSTPRPPCVFSAPFSSFPDSSASRAPGASGGAPISPCPSFSSPLPDFSFCLRERRIFPICSPFSARRFRRPRRDLRRLWGIFRTPALFLPLLDAYRYKKGDGKKIALSFAGGGAFVPRFSRPVLRRVRSPCPPAGIRLCKDRSVLPRACRRRQVRSAAPLYDDRRPALLLRLYPAIVRVLLYAAVGTQKRVLPSVVLNAALFLYVLLCTGFYNVLYYAIARRLFWVFLLFADVVPLLALLLLAGRKDGAPPRNIGLRDAKGASGQRAEGKTGRQAENGRESGSEKPPERHPERRPEEAPAPSSRPKYKRRKKGKGGGKCLSAVGRRTAAIR